LTGVGTFCAVFARGPIGGPSTGPISSVHNAMAATTRKLMVVSPAPIPNPAASTTITKATAVPVGLILPQKVIRTPNPGGLRDFWRSFAITGPLAALTGALEVLKDGNNHAPEPRCVRLQGVLFLARSSVRLGPSSVPAPSASEVFRPRSRLPSIADGVPGFFTESQPAMEPGVATFRLRDGIPGLVRIARIGWMARKNYIADIWVGHASRA